MSKGRNDLFVIVVMLALGFALAANPYTNKINPGLVRGLTWLLSGLGKNLK